MRVRGTDFGDVTHTFRGDMDLPLIDAFDSFESGARGMCVEVLRLTIFQFEVAGREVPVMPGAAWQVLVSLGAPPARVPEGEVVRVTAFETRARLRAGRGRAL